MKDFVVLRQVTSRMNHAQDGMWQERIVAHFQEDGRSDGSALLHLNLFSRMGNSHFTMSKEEARVLAEWVLSLDTE